MSDSLSWRVDLRNVSHARQRLIVRSNLEPHSMLGNDMMSSDSIRGLSVTPGGRLLVAHSVSSVPLSCNTPYGLGHREAWVTPQASLYRMPNGVVFSFFSVLLFHIELPGLCFRWLSKPFL